MFQLKFNMIKLIEDTKKTTALCSHSYRCFNFVLCILRSDESRLFEKAKMMAVKFLVAVD